MSYLNEIATAQELAAFASDLSDAGVRSTHMAEIAASLIARSYRRSVERDNEIEMAAGLMAYRATHREWTRTDEVDKRYWRANAAEVAGVFGLEVTE